jgi:hypothetical protein
MPAPRKRRSKDKARREFEDRIRRSPVLSIQARTLWVEIDRGWCWDDKSCYPSQETLGNAIGLSVRSIRRYQKELEEAKVLIVRNHPKKGNCYFIPDELPEDVAPRERVINTNIMSSVDRTRMAGHGADDQPDLAAHAGQGRPPTPAKDGRSDRPGMAADDERIEDEPREDELTEDSRATARSGRGPNGTKPSSVTPQGWKAGAKGNGITTVTLKGQKPPRQQRAADPAIVPGSARKLPESFSEVRGATEEPEFVVPPDPPPRNAESTWDYFNKLLEEHGFSRQPGAFKTLPKIHQRRLGELAHRFINEPETLMHMLQVLVGNWLEIRVALGSATRHPSDPLKGKPTPTLSPFLAGKQENVLAYCDCWVDWAQGQKPDPVRREKDRVIDAARAAWRHKPKFKPNEGAE